MTALTFKETEPESLSRTKQSQTFSWVTRSTLVGNGEGAFIVPLELFVSRVPIFAHVNSVQPFFSQLAFNRTASHRGENIVLRHSQSLA